jgi:hypothetical protein
VKVGSVGFGWWNGEFFWRSGSAWKGKLVPGVTPIFCSLAWRGGVWGKLGIWLLGKRLKEQLLGNTSFHDYVKY